MWNSRGLRTETVSFLKAYGFRKLPLLSPTVEFDTSVKKHVQKYPPLCRKRQHSCRSSGKARDKANYKNAAAFPCHFSLINNRYFKIITLCCEHSKDQACCVLVYNGQLDDCGWINKICVCLSVGEENRTMPAAFFIWGEMKIGETLLMVCLNWPVRVAMTPVSWVAMTAASSHRAQIHLIIGLIDVCSQSELFYYKTLLWLNNHGHSLFTLV